MHGWARILLATAVAAPGVCAATITSATGQFYNDKWNGTPRRVDGDSSHFFDNPSTDSVGAATAGCNIGYYITGDGGGCNYQPGGIDRFTGAGYNGPNRGTDGLPWLGNTSTTNNLDFSFTPQSPNFTVQLMAEATPDDASNVLGVYTTDTVGNIAATLVLFAGSDTPGKTVQFSPGNSNWGFYFMTGAGSYYTQRLLGADATLQHFAVFRDAADLSTGLNFRKLWIGAEQSASLFPDYNDMIFTLSCVECGMQTGSELGETPEPDTFATFGTGAVFIGAAVLLGRIRAWRATARVRVERGSVCPPVARSLSGADLTME